MPSARIDITLLKSLARRRASPGAVFTAKIDRYRHNPRLQIKPHLTIMAAYGGERGAGRGINENLSSR